MTQSFSKIYIRYGLKSIDNTHTHIFVCACVSILLGGSYFNCAIEFGKPLAHVFVTERQRMRDFKRIKNVHESSLGCSRMKSKKAII